MIAWVAVLVRVGAFPGVAAAHGPVAPNETAVGLDYRGAPYLDDRAWELA